MQTKGNRLAARLIAMAVALVFGSILTGVAPPLSHAHAQTALQKSVGDILDKGVVIVVSKSSQTMHVFKDGEHWRSSPVSTGKRGKETPSGVFAILQKRRSHFSNLYNNAPMPFMQRLTWDGIAIHAGHLPGYPASHGCIRLPEQFARDLFALTEFASTAVIIVDEPVADSPAALTLASASEQIVPIAEHHLARERRAANRASNPPRTIARRTIAARSPAEQGSQTIQLAAALSQAEATEQWTSLLALRPELEAMQMTVIPAIVRGRQYYRLRASSPDAHTTCTALKRAGIDCFPVV